MFERNVTRKIRKYLHTDDIIVLHGARQVGKTSIMKLLYGEIAPENRYFMDLEDRRFLDLCDGGAEDVVAFLRQKGLLCADAKVRFFLFVDEIQYLADPSSFLKLMHDHYANVKLVVSGSSSFDIKKKFSDSLVGRTIDFEIFPLDFSEFLMFVGEGIDVSRPVRSSPLVERLRKRYREYVLYGGYPKIVLTDDVEMKERYLQQIIDTYIRKDIRDLAQITDVDKFNRLVYVLASQSGGLLNVTELSATTRLARQTIDGYLLLLENTYVIKLLSPHHGNVRSELFKMPKVFFYDTGLLTMLCLRTLPKEISGSALETSVFSELVKRAGTEGLRYWRTQDKKEIDFVVSHKGGIDAIEVKSNAARFSKSATRVFLDAYPKARAWCVCLDGEGADIDGVRFVRPWELPV